ncbi:hypothetical protein [Deinococcus yavapaiensis]|uniref:Calcineurin-like phosphoesterase family protein n=1 Tax=Deinococcus yavapaiensis KR-236 TaxID=694435 RepID=A0A318S3J7_9DEIO|nr:hypothetical protein [Deinococcus yavapaiensis]PYE50939.1 hypothetical protein DES52_1165 [Deinococcus yavapaiensis KR-236]
MAGNHDVRVEREPGAWRGLLPRNVTYFEVSGAEFQGVRFWGTPWTLTFYDWAFMEDEAQLRLRFARMPKDTPVRITHGPTWSFLDLTARGERAGSYAQLERLSLLGDHLRLHAHGYIHEAHGQLRVGR